jgi:hypothetical protein
LKIEYAKPVLRMPMTFAEIAPVRAVVALATTAILRNSRAFPAAAAREGQRSDPHKSRETLRDDRAQCEQQLRHDRCGARAARNVSKACRQQDEHREHVASIARRFYQHSAGIGQQWSSRP